MRARFRLISREWCYGHELGIEDRPLLNRALRPLCRPEFSDVPLGIIKVKLACNEACYFHGTIWSLL